MININFNSNEIAIVDGNQKISYKKLKIDILGLIDFFKKKKIKKQQIVCVELENCYLYVVLYLACFYYNLIIVPINKNSTKKDKKKIIKSLKPRLYIKKKTDLIINKTKTKQLPIFNNFLPNSIFFSSGTTQEPKGIIHNFYSLSNSSKNFINSNTNIKNLNFLSFLPMSYMAGFLNSILNILFQNGTIFIERKFDFDYSS